MQASGPPSAMLTVILIATIIALDEGAVPGHQAPPQESTKLVQAGGPDAGNRPPTCRT